MTEDADLAMGELRPSFRPMVIAGVVNLLVAALLLGVPYFRGPRRAAEVPRRFAVFAACFYDAARIDDPGLGLPRGERSRYAALVLSAADDWPARCRDELLALPPDDSMFLFPDVKNAEAHLRAAVELMSVEMETLISRRAAGDLLVSDRPMRAMATLRGALAELGVVIPVRGLRADRDAVRFEEEVSIPQSSIVPLRVSEGGEWDIAVEEGALLSQTMDSRAVVYVRVLDGAVEQRITRRSAQITALVGPPRMPWVVWSTSPARCAESEDGCERQATGLAAFLDDHQTLEPMMWLSAHPLGAPGQAIYVASSTAWIVSVGLAEALVRRFPLPPPEVRALGQELEPTGITADTSWPLMVDAGATFAWIGGDPPRLLFAQGTNAGVLELRDGAIPETFEGPGGRVQATSCGGWLAIGSEEGLVVRPDGGEAWREPQRVVPPEPHGLAVVCRGGRLEVFTLADHTLSRSLCEPPGPCARAERLLEGVASFDAVDHAGTTLVAWSDGDRGAVRVTRLTPTGALTTVPAPCWSDPPDGLCGEPRLASDGHTVMLATRLGEDLRVVQSRDGVRFEPLIGLAQP